MRFLACKSLRVAGTFLVLLLLVGCDEAVPSWQRAYDELLLRHAEVTAHLEPEELWRFDLIDIDQNGVPELIIWEASGTFLSIYGVYTFRDGEIVKIGRPDVFGGRAWNISAVAPPGGEPGVVITGGGGEGFFSMTLVRLDEDYLCTYLSAFSTRGYLGNMLFYVNGMEAAPRELEDYLYWSEHESLLAQGYSFTTEEEFVRIRYQYFGISLPLSELSLTITPSGVRQAILGM
ncbi:MAG: hypothetical protein FWC78_09125 [Defluviitaleaceae bacterium]|nr:hypothetical protein [Defluviitaleaceae bacterium]